MSLVLPIRAVHARCVRFGYYRRLSREDKAIYRKSDEHPRIELPDPRALCPTAREIGDALAEDDRIRVEKLSQKLVRGICRQLGVPIAGIRVMAVRPKSASHELHGLYVRGEEETPVIMVWMRTAERRAPVAHRAYLRTLFHEVGHHLDYEHLELADSFHTRGFFQRESSLMRQLLPRSSASEDTPAKSPRKTEPARRGQLELPL